MAVLRVARGLALVHFDRSCALFTVRVTLETATLLHAGFKTRPAWRTRRLQLSALERAPRVCDTRQLEYSISHVEQIQEFHW